MGGLIGLPSSSLDLSNSLMVGSYYKTGGTAYLSRLVGTNSTSTKVSNCYYKNGLSSSTSFGTAIT